MYLLDTNVISELRKLRRGPVDAAFLHWSATVDTRDQYLSVMTIQEIEFGILSVQRTDSVQAAALRLWLDDYVIPTFANRILPVEIAIAKRSAALHVGATRAYRDSFIAATAYVHQFAVVTRNVSDFRDTGVRIINPWQQYT
jgi:predicted nucleic acid-binding protein